MIECFGENPFDQVSISHKSTWEKRMDWDYVTRRQDIWGKFYQVPISDRVSVIERRR